MEAQNHLLNSQTSPKTGTFSCLYLRIVSQTHNNVLHEIPEKATSSQLLNLTSLQEQYVFLHQAVMEALTCGNTEIAPQDFRITMNKLARAQKSSQRTGFAKEFKVLHLCLSCFKY